MKHTRRGFFATLLAAVAAPLVAKVIPKRKTTGTLFDPHVDIAAQYLKYRCAVGTGYLSPYYDPDVPMLELLPKPLTFHSDCFAFVYPKIGEHIRVKTPLRYLGLTSPTSAPASDPPLRQS